MQFAVQLNNKQAALFVKHFYRMTNPIKPHEAEIIKNILQTEHEQHDWRTLNHVFCSGCRRELTSLDLFLSGLKHHSPQYIHDFLYRDAHGGGEIAFHDGIHPTIQVFRHNLRVTCIECGVVTDEGIRPEDHIYGYKRPRMPICVISVSEKIFSKIMALVEADLAK